MHDKVAPEDLAKWNRWFAVDCNNRAWRLSEASTRSASEDDEMLHCAHAVLANAAAAARDRENHAKHHAIAQSLGTALPDAEERAIFDATFRVVPVPA